MLSVKQGASSIIFWIFGMTRLGIEPRSFGPLVNHLISVWRPDLIIINKKKKKEKEKRTWKIVGFSVLTDHRVKLKEREKKDKYFDLAREWKKTVGHESDVYTNCNWCSWYSYRTINEGTGGLENKMTSGDHPNNCIIEISQNTEKDTGDLMRLAVTQTHLKDHQLMLM